MSELTFNADPTGAVRGMALAGRLVLQKAGLALSQAAIVVRDAASVLAPKAEGTLSRMIQRRRAAVFVQEIVASAPHARFVEKGTGTYGPEKRPSGLRMLPDSGVAAIALWIQRRGIVPRSPGITPEQLPWIIARKIARDGTPAQPFMEPALEKSKPLIVSLIDRASRAGLAEAGVVA